MERIFILDISDPSSKNISKFKIAFKKAVMKDSQLFKMMVNNYHTIYNQSSSLKSIADKADKHIKCLYSWNLNGDHTSLVSISTNPDLLEDIASKSNISSKKEKDMLAYFIFNHEIAHALTIDKASSYPKNYMEILADCFATIRTIQKYGSDHNVIEKISNYRFKDLILNKNTDHYTSIGIEKALKIDTSNTSIKESIFHSNLFAYSSYLSETEQGKIINEINSLDDLREETTKSKTMDTIKNLYLKNRSKYKGITSEL